MRMVKMGDYKLSKELGESKGCHSQCLIISWQVKLKDMNPNTNLKKCVFQIEQEIKKI